MYDYATVTMQNRILSELQNVNSNLVMYNEILTYLIILIIIILLSFVVHRFIMRCLGK